MNGSIGKEEQKSTQGMESPQENGLPISPILEHGKTHIDPIRVLKESHKKNSLWTVFGLTLLSTFMLCGSLLALSYSG